MCTHFIMQWHLVNFLYLISIEILFGFFFTIVHSICEGFDPETNDACLIVKKNKSNMSVISGKKTDYVFFSTAAVNAIFPLNSSFVLTFYQIKLGLQRAAHELWYRYEVVALNMLCCCWCCLIFMTVNWITSKVKQFLRNFSWHQFEYLLMLSIKITSIQWQLHGCFSPICFESELWIHHTWVFQFVKVKIEIVQNNRFLYIWSQLFQFISHYFLLDIFLLWNYTLR